MTCVAGNQECRHYGHGVVVVVVAVAVARSPPPSRLSTPFLLPLLPSSSLYLIRSIAHELELGPDTPTGDVDEGAAGPRVFNERKD